MYDSYRQLIIRNKHYINYISAVIIWWFLLCSSNFSFFFIEFYRRCYNNYSFLRMEDSFVGDNCFAFLDFAYSLYLYSLIYINYMPVVTVRWFLSCSSNISKRTISLAAPRASLFDAPFWSANLLLLIFFIIAKAIIVDYKESWKNTELSRLIRATRDAPIIGL